MKLLTPTTSAANDVGLPANEEAQVFEIRKVRIAADMSQSEVARGLGLSENSGRQTVSQIESRKDWLLSSVSAYIRAAGGTAELIVKVGDTELRFTIA